MAQRAGRAPRRRGARATWTRSSSCPASAARRRTSCSATRSAFPGLPVDRHVLRVANRIGIAESRRSRARRAAADAARCRRSGGRARPTRSILHGRRICSPKPLCDAVRVADALRLLREASSRERPPRRVSASPRRQPQPRRKPRSPNADDTRRFEQLVAEALRTIPRRFRDEMRNIAIVVEDEPADELLDEMEIEPPDTLFGLYQGTPLTERRWDYGNTLPDRISLYPGSHRRRERRRGRRRRRDRRDADPRGRPLLRPERRGIEDDRGAVLAGARTTRRRGRRRDGAAALRPALPRPAWVGTADRGRSRLAPTDHVPRDRPGPRRADACRWRARVAARDGRRDRPRPGAGSARPSARPTSGSIEGDFLDVAARRALRRRRRRAPVRVVGNLPYNVVVAHPVPAARAGAGRPAGCATPR